MQIIRFGYVYEEDCDMSDKTPVLYCAPIDRPLVAHNTESCRNACHCFSQHPDYKCRPYLTKSLLPISLDITSDGSTATGSSVAAFESKCLEAVSLNCQAGYDELESIIFNKLPVIKGVWRDCHLKAHAKTV